MVKVVDAVYRGVTLCQSKNLMMRNRKRLGDQNPDDSCVRDNGNGLGPMPGQQEIARAKNTGTHLTEAFAVGEPAVGGPFHPGMESVRIARLDFFISESFEVSK